MLFATRWWLAQRNPFWDSNQQAHLHQTAPRADGTVWNEERIIYSIGPCAIFQFFILNDKEIESQRQNWKLLSQMDSARCHIFYVFPPQHLPPPNIHTKPGKGKPGPSVSFFSLSFSFLMSNIILAIQECCRKDSRCGMVLASSSRQRPQWPSHPYPLHPGGAIWLVFLSPVGRGECHSFFSLFSSGWP